MNFFKVALIVFTLCLFKTGQACVAPDCDRLDCGTCGNACCTMEYYFDLSPENLNTALVEKMKNSGPDGRYFFVDYTDLRPYNKSAHFISQGIHTTFKRQYNDTVNFVIKPVDSRNIQSKLTAFSISQIAGAYCDDGQNYKNLIALVKSLGQAYDERHVSGCDTINP